ncbi:MAG: hypothetical protein KatS3mg077_2064 [Candidatus Binatia bacterium]|nr:MAG: hypothetical protein KatS3mg077_2064 [Candidatus Binatia bacterium]
MPDFVCVLREPEFSPGKVEADAAILVTVAGLLRREQYVVDVLDPRSRHWPQLPRRTVVLSMAQGEEALARLHDWESQGIRVINSVAAVRNCHRLRAVELLRHAGIAAPAAVVVPTDAAALPSWVDDASGVWVKRGDVHAMVAADVQFVAGRHGARRALRELRSRGISTAVVQRHVRGRTVKFYAVGDQFFFIATAGNGGAAPWERRLASLARRAGGAFGLEVFGGDCIVEPNGECQLIDLNDWPSYAACRQNAAEAIAAYARAEKAKVA